MDKITTKQAAEQWGISDRTVQDHCIKGRISGAERWGRTWMIPADAEKPKDGRTKTAKQTEEYKPYIVTPKQTPQLIMSNLYSTPGSGEECIEKLSSTPETAALFEGWLAFSQGDIAKAIDLTLPLLQIEADFYGTLNVGMLTMACAIWKNDAALWRTGRAHISGGHCADEYEQKIRDLWLGINDAGVLTNIQNLHWYSWAEFNKLPEDSIPAVWFYYAKHMYKIARSIAHNESNFPDIEGLGMLRMYPYLVEPLIAQVQRAGCLLAEICIRLLCADAYFSVDMREAGMHHLNTALNLAVPDKLYGVLAEFRTLLNTLMDERLEEIDADVAKSVKKIHNDRIANWIEMTNKTVTDTLSERQREIAKLAALGLTNDEIAERLQISYHTVKSTISMIMNKTGAKKRSEFSSHIF